MDGIVTRQIVPPAVSQGPRVLPSNSDGLNSGTVSRPMLSVANRGRVRRVTRPFSPEFADYTGRFIVTDEDFDHER